MHFKVGLPRNKPLALNQTLNPKPWTDLWAQGVLEPCAGTSTMRLTQMMTWWWWWAVCPPAWWDPPRPPRCPS